MDLLLQTLSGVFEGFGLEYEGFSFPGLRLVALQGLAGFFVTENQETLFQIAIRISMTMVMILSVNLYLRQGTALGVKGQGSFVERLKISGGTRDKGNPADRFLGVQVPNYEGSA